MCVACILMLIDCMWFLQPLGLVDSLVYVHAGVVCVVSGCVGFGLCLRYEF